MILITYLVIINKKTLIINVIIIFQAINSRTLMADDVFAELLCFIKVSFPFN